MEQSIKIFISYTRKDTALREELDKHLSQLRQQQFIDVWHDRDIDAGTERQSEIDIHLNAAQIILLLISPDFIASKYYFSIEMKRALERHKRGEALVIPVLLRPTDWQYPPLNELQALPRDAKPVTSWRKRDDAFLDIVNGLKKAIESMSRSEASKGRYNASWNTMQPGCLIFLLDQSSTMCQPYGLAQLNSRETKSIVAAGVINSFLNELIAVSTIPHAHGDAEVRPCVELAILGYGNGIVQSLFPGVLASRMFVNLPELSMNPLSTEKRMCTDFDDMGRQYKVPIPFPIWVRPKAQGDAPLCAALRFAQTLADQWAITHPYSYPPVVINIAGGVGTDGDPLELMQDLCQVNTNDGHVLLFNVCISSLNHPPIAYPAVETVLPNVLDVKKLLLISSIIPENNLEILETMIGQILPQNARGFIFNGDAASIRWMWSFASRPKKERGREYK